MTNQQSLRAMMKEHNLTFKKVSEMCKVNIFTAKSWCAKSDAKWYRNMPDNILELLKIKIAMKKSD